MGCVGSVLDPALYNLNYGVYCAFPITTPQTTVKAFSSTLLPVQPVTLDTVRNTITAMYPPLEVSPPRYQIEAVRGNGSQQCSYCPYDNLPDGTNPIVYATGGVPVERAPMYGPCFNRQRSIKVACVQNTLLFPPTFVGEYFYPDQSVLTGTSIPNSVFFAEHRYLNMEVLSLNLAPSKFALGRSRIRDQLSSFAIVSASTNVTNETLTKQFFQDYLTVAPSSDEGWLMWGQHYCAPGCHRNGEYQLVYVRTTDWKNQSALLQFLNRRNVDGTPMENLIRCKVCPLYNAAYLWSDKNEIPVDQLAWNAVASTCYPWFGGIPLLDSGTLAFQTASLEVHDKSVDGVVKPASSTYIATQACPVNTYNDVCAQTIRYYARTAKGMGTPAPTVAEISNAQGKTGCKPCPAGGYHTDGKTGAWFCLPPTGQLMKNRGALLASLDARNNESNAWSRRDKLGYEFECGYLPSHCVQCSQFAMPAGTLPDDFNQQIILGPLLKVEPCPEGKFCPHPLRVEPQACPASKPWSPAGSWSLSNCTCAKGTFWNQTRCQACPAWNSCAAGMFLSGWTNCMYTNGVTSPGTCQSCANKPATAYYTGAGMESFGSSSGGVCPFSCPLGKALMGVPSAASPSFCLYAWECQPVKPFVVFGGSVQVYSEKLQTLTDSLNILPSLTCDFAPTLSSTMAAYAKDDTKYAIVSTSCLGKGVCSSTWPCKVAQDATYASDVACVSCPIPPAAASYTRLAQSQSTAADARGLMCQTACDLANWYVNKTTNQCQSCAVLTDALCPHTGTWQVRGGGCLANMTEFPATPALMHPDDWCVPCALQVANAPADQYLDVNACKYVSCEKVIAGYSYRAVPCGGSENLKGVVTPCTTLSDCQTAYQYLDGSCTADRTPVCTNCTVSKPGFYMAQECTYLALDANWLECPAGYFCEGSKRAPQPCPYPKISQSGARGIYDCFCPAGMARVDSDNTCAPMQCGDAVAYTAAPGIAVKSAYYMELDVEKRATKCTLCPSGSFTLDEHAVGIGACRCAADYFLQQGQQCVPCASGCAGCWRGDIANGCDSSSSSAAPFMASTSACTDGFDLSPTTTRNKNVAGTGSAAYVPEADARTGWSTLFSAGHYTITQLAVTSVSQNSDGSPDALQLAFFTVDASPLTVYVKPLPPLDYGSADPFSSYPFWCPVVGSRQDVGAQYKAVQLAVSQWRQLNQYTQSGARFNASFSAFVGQVVYNLNDDSLVLLTNQVSLSNKGDPVWFTADGCGAFKQYETLISGSFLANETDVPAVQHQFAYPGSETPDNTFYVAFNDWKQRSCGVIAYNVDNNNKHVALDLSKSDGRRITAMAVMSSSGGSSGGIMLYVAFDTSPNTVRLVQWMAETSSPASEGDELFVTESGLGIMSLSYAWGTDQVLWARGIKYFLTQDTNASSLTGSVGIYTADKSFQRTFTKVQQMHPASHPTLGPFVVGTGQTTGLMVAAHGSTISYISISRCVPTYNAGLLEARYWPDGGGECALHTCLRPRSCAGDSSRQHYDNDLHRCVCNPGFFKTSDAPLVCSDCPEGYYCQDGLKTECGSGLTTISSVNARSEWDCVCGLGRSAASTSSSVSCADCAVGAWCPNQWDSIACPGAVDLQRMGGTFNAIYPYACVCAAGSTGPGCTPCPVGYFCAAGATTVTNYVLGLSLSFVAYPQSSGAICDVLQQRLLVYFQKTDPGVQIYCAYIAASTLRTRPLGVLMVQTISASQAERMAEIWSNFTSPAGDFTVVATDTQTSSFDVASNVPKLCPVPGKIPLADGTSCQCAAGFKTSASNQCIACDANYYKAAPGVGGCTACPSGTTSAVGASVCVSSSKAATNSSSSSSQTASTNIPAIAGGAVGGLVLVGLIILGVNQLYAVPAVEAVAAASA